MHYSDPIHSESLKIVGKRIHDARVALNLTQAQLSEALGISISYVSCLERGTRPITHHILPQLMTRLNLDYDSLFANTCGFGFCSPLVKESSSYSFDNYYKMERLLAQCSKEEYEMCYSLCKAYIEANRGQKH